jgi:hypothetical protein
MAGAVGGGSRGATVGFEAQSRRPPVEGTKASEVAAESIASARLAYTKASSTSESAGQSAYASQRPGTT